MLSRKIELGANTGDDEAEKKFANIRTSSNLRKGDVEDRVFISEEQHEVLAKFELPQSLTWRYLRMYLVIGILKEKSSFPR